MRSHNLFDAIDRRSMTLRVKMGTFLAEHLFDFGIALVERINEVRCGSSGHAAAHRAVIDQHDMSIFAREQTGGGDAGDSRADNADLCRDIL